MRAGGPTRGAWPLRCGHSVSCEVGIAAFILWVPGAEAQRGRVPARAACLESALRRPRGPGGAEVGLRGWVQCAPDGSWAPRQHCPCGMRCRRPRGAVAVSELGTALPLKLPDPLHHPAASLLRGVVTQTLRLSRSSESVRKTFAIPGRRHSPNAEPAADAGWSAVPGRTRAWGDPALRTLNPRSLSPAHAGGQEDAIGQQLFTDQGVVSLVVF